MEQCLEAIKAGANYTDISACNDYVPLLDEVLKPYLSLENTFLLGMLGIFFAYFLCSLFDLT